MSTSPQKPKTKKQLNQEALVASLDHRWEEAIELNNELLDRFPRDAEALNRIGRANMEMGNLAAAREAYSDALKADPANMIARRNLQRLETIYHADGANEAAPARSQQRIPNPSVFVKEIGRTWIDDLTHPAENDVLAQVSPGDQLQLEVKGERVYVHSLDGAVLGQVDQMIAGRMARLMGIGHAFEIYALGQTMNSLRFIIRETERADESEGKLTFPRQDFANQHLLREREQLSLREEGDFDFGEDEDLEDEADNGDEDDVDDTDIEDADEDDEFIDESLDDDEEDIPE